MRHVNPLLFAVFLALLTNCTPTPPQSADHNTWIAPSVDWSTFNFHKGYWEFTIQKVEFGTDETTVHMKVHGFEGRMYSFGSQTTLKADGKTYKLLSLDGIEPDQYRPMNRTNNDFLTFHFEPMPASVKSFDLVEKDGDPNAFNLYGIHMHDPNSLALNYTFWKSTRTGNWIIGFMDGGHVIYDCKVWTYEGKLDDASTSVQDITIKSGDLEAKVQIGALKKGKRTIRIQAPDGTKQFTCTSFDSRNVPDYQRAERRNYRLWDYGYQDTVSTTINGQLIGQGRTSTTFTIDYPDAIRNEIVQHTFQTDSNGYFSVTLPLVNTTDAVIRHNRASGFSMPLEPGRTYFVYSNVDNNREYVMGQRSRLQNEFLAYQDVVFSSYKRIEETDDEHNMEAYLEYLITERDAKMARLDSLYKVHPSISDALLDFARVSATLDIYSSIGQARFHNPDRSYRIPGFMIDFIRNDIRTNSIKPYSLFYEFNYFMDDFTDALAAEPNRTLPITLRDLADYCVKNGKVTFTPDEQELINWYEHYDDMVRKVMEEIGPDDKRISDTLDIMLSDDEKEKMNEAVKLTQDKNLMAYVDEFAQLFLTNNEMSMILAALDTLGFESQLSDIVLSHYMLRNLKSSRHSMSATFINLFDSIVSFEPCIQAVHAVNDKYLALENVDLASLGNDVSAQDLAGMSDGEQILRKITEAYRGKIVYIDVWGSWCGPCLENLSHTAELKAALKEFDIVYLYLASSTGDNAWKGVIKEYNLTGPDCVHYNLPADQQTLVEHFLNVTGYPTYRLLNRNGALLNVQCSPNNLPALIETLKKL